MGSRIQLAQCTPDQAKVPDVEPGGISSFLAPTTPVEGLYVHVPFCRHRCHYCDFFTIAGREDAFDAYVDRLKSEIRASASCIQGPLQTVFIGGGTPTILPPKLLAEVLQEIRSALPVASDCEWSVEANPETVTPEIAAALADGGVTRVSLGAQSFQPERLKALERRHDPATVERSLQRLRSAGIDELSLDLIFAIPGQTLAQWESDLDIAVGLGIRHLSAYSLIYEQGTPLTRRRDRGEVAPIPEDLEAAMFEHAIRRLDAEGMRHYEVSNWAIPGSECRHNLLYWRNQDWWPIGPGASGHVQGIRWKNVPRLGLYLEGQGLPPVTRPEQLDEDGRIGEAFMMGLRLLQGIPVQRLESLLACGDRSGARRRAIEGHVADGHLIMDAVSLRFTPRGLMVADSIMVDLL
ncbi:MAG: coproporphyrinogen III oxidase [Phycisphaerae bacterium]|mgnify:CR=1 FL=1|nr:coproporphyrinogen III oxidase [Phycisphaerae bacterium]MDG1898699.1 radical SAM family heme chaperone HemW [Phycisphaerales bacterium]|tara:strand:- start:39 stop:1262 length:1224 start_codon:yes stop_codon:yes gene_type:complete